MKNKMVFVISFIGVLSGNRRRNRLRHYETGAASRL